MRTPEEILKTFDRGYPKFKWFIEKYFEPRVIITLERTRKEKNVTMLITILNRIWYALPDDEFNIKVNPAGWAEFLNVIEE